MDHNIGTTAGNIWHFLDTNGSASIMRLKAQLGISNTLLYLALGWLLREDKVNIEPRDHTYLVSLK